MLDIYGNSALTLAATSSASGDGEIFSERPRRVLTESAIVCTVQPKEIAEGPADYDLECLASKSEANPDDPAEQTHPAPPMKIPHGSQISTLLVRKPVLSHAIQSGRFDEYHNVEGFPLDDRAWCFQERILSPRVVHFGKDELVWECNAQTDCDCGGINREGDRSLRSLFNKLARLEDPHLRSYSWMDMVTKCASRKVTKQSDRLPTIFGLAQCLQRWGFGGYLAGRWRDDLLAQLLW